MRRLALLALVAVAALITGSLPAAGHHGSLDPHEKTRHVFNDNRSTGGHVMIEGRRLYLGAWGEGFRIFDVSDALAPRQIGAYLPGGRFDAVPDAAVFDGRHIAVLNGTRRVSSRSGPAGTVEGTDISEFLDVTDPAQPRLLWKFVGQQDGEAHNGDIFDARRLWLPSGGTGTNGLRIYDMNPLLVEPPQAPANLVRANPVDLWAASPYRGDKPVGPAFTHTHDVSIYPGYSVSQLDGTSAARDIILLAEGGNYADDGPNYGTDHGNTGSVFVIDITDPSNPVVLLRWLHQRGPDHHPIRYHHEAQFLASDQHVMLVTDEDLHHPCGEGDGGAVDTAGGGAVAVRLSDTLTEATELSESFIPAGTPAAVCSVHVFSSRGKYVFFGSYNAGLQVFDYSDPANPRRAGYYIAPGTTAWGAQIYKNGVVYVGDMDRGLDVYVFDPLARRGGGGGGGG